MTDYKKVTRKSRDQKEKTEGVRFKKTSKTKQVSPLQPRIDWWNSMSHKERESISGLGFYGDVDYDELDPTAKQLVNRAWVRKFAFGQKNWQRMKRTRVTGVPTGIIVKEGIAISSTIVNERTGKLVDEGSKIFRDRDDLAGFINTDTERINTLLTSKPRSEKLDNEQIKTLVRFSSAIEGATERLENKFGNLFAGKDAEKIDDELDNIDIDIDNFVSDNFSNRTWHEDVQKLRDIKKEVKRLLRVVMIQSGSLRSEVRRLKERDSDFNRKATLGSNLEIRKSLNQAQIELLNLSSTTRDIDKRFQHSFGGS